MLACFRPFVGFLPSVFLVGCITTEPQANRIQFEDRPSSYAPSSYRAEASTERQVVASGADFYRANDLAMERGGHEIAEERARRAEARAASASASSSSSSSGSQGASSPSFTSSGYNNMKVTYDQLRNTAPASGTNTIRVSLGNVAYSITYDFYPGSYMCHGGDLTGATVNVKFSSGRPISVKNFHGGEGYVDVKSYEHL